jgi:hypothetical protein
VLLALAAEARARGARSGLGTATRVLLASRLPDGRWVGHAEDHVLVAVTPCEGDPADLENAIVTVRRTGIDDLIAERVTGEILAIHPAPRTLRTPLPVLAGAGSMTDGGMRAR